MNNEPIPKMLNERGESIFSVDGMMPTYYDIFLTLHKPMKQCDIQRVGIAFFYLLSKVFHKEETIIISSDRCLISHSFQRIFIRSALAGISYYDPTSKRFVFISD